MVVVSAVTLWLLLSAFFLFGIFGLPRFYARAAMTLLCVELLALLMIPSVDPGSLEARALEVLVARDIPALGVLLYALAILSGRRLTRRSR